MSLLVTTRGLGKRGGFLATIGLGVRQPDVVPPRGGGGTSIGLPGRSHFNQAPSTKDKIDPLMMQQILQEDEELLIMIKAFAETIRWH